MMKTLKDMYDLEYAEISISSSLIKWYNNLIDKTYEDLNIADVSKMIRQDILFEVAIQKAIELFLLDPYAGEYDYGGLLEIIANIGIEKLPSEKLNDILNYVAILEQIYDKFMWEDDENKIEFGENLAKIRNNILGNK